MKTESGVCVRFWFHMLVAAANANNVTYKPRLDCTPHKIAYGVKKDISEFRTFGCKAIMYLEDVQRDCPGKLADRAAEGTQGINLGLAFDQSTSRYKIYFPKERTIKITNQVRFDESIFPMKDAIKARQQAITEDPIATFDDFPPDDGRYSVRL